MNETKFRTFLSLIINNVIAIISEVEKITEIEAINSFYQSETYQLLEKEQTKYWWFSPEALYEEYLEERGWSYENF